MGRGGLNLVVVANVGDMFLSIGDVGAAGNRCTTRSSTEDVA